MLKAAEQNGIAPARVEARRLRACSGMWTRLAVVMALAGIALAFASPAFADRAQESALAERYSPVVRLVAHTDLRSRASRTCRST